MRNRTLKLTMVAGVLVGAAAWGDTGAPTLKSLPFDGTISDVMIFDEVLVPDDLI